MLLFAKTLHATFSVRFRLESGKICKNKDHTCLFHCINTCQVPRTMFEHLAGRPRIQTASSGPGKCKCMKKMCDPYSGLQINGERYDVHNNVAYIMTKL